MWPFRRRGPARRRPGRAPGVRGSRRGTRARRPCDQGRRGPTTFRRQGFGVVAAVPTAGVLRGQGAVVSLADGPISGRVLDPSSGQVVAMKGPGGADYPASNMGAVAVTRQAVLDALWWRDAEAAYTAGPSGKVRPRFVAATAALVPAAEGRETVVFETTDVLSLLRAVRIANELKLKARFVAAGDEYRLLPEVAAARPDLVLRVAFPQPDKLDREEEWLDVSMTSLRAFDRAPGDPRWLRDAGVSFSFTTAGLDAVGDFDKRVREAIGRGLSADDALAAVTTVPARQLGLGDRLGTLEAGKVASLVVRSGAPFEDKSTVSEIWIDGERIEICREDQGWRRRRRRPHRRRACVRLPLARPGRWPRRRPSSCAARPCGRRAPRGSSRAPTFSSSTAGSPPSGRASRPRPARWRSTAAASTSPPASSTLTRTARWTTPATRPRTTSRPKCASATSFRPSTPRSIGSSPAGPPSPTSFTARPTRSEGRTRS